MTRDDAEQLLGILVGATTGWTTAPDETFRFYTEQIGLLRDVDAAAEAIRDLGATWTEARRPPVAEINRAYASVQRRRIMARPALPPSRETIPSVETGRQIAARAYADECARRGDGDPYVVSGFRTTEPSTRFLSSILGSTSSGQQ